MKTKFLFLALALSIFKAQAQVKPTISWVESTGQDSTINAISTCIDGSSKVYSTGRIYVSPTNPNIILQCKDSTGLILWTYTYDNGAYDAPKKIKVDAAGNTYIAGVSYGSSTNNDYVVIKVSSNGSQVWLKRFDRGINSIDEANDLALDGSGNVYVTGKSRGPGGNDDVVTLKFNGSSGAQVWQHIYNPNNLNDEGVGLVVANNNSDVIVSSTIGTATQGLNIVAYRLNCNTGGIGWSTTINGSANSNDKCRAIILSGGNVVLCGSVNNTGRGDDYVTVKLAGTSGSVVFRKEYNFASAADVATSLVRDSTGNIAVTGIAFNSSTALYEYHTQCFDSTGNPKWTHKALINCSGTNANPTIVCDTIAHHFYVAGEKQNSDRDVYVYQLTPGGNVGWEKSYTAPYTGSTDVGTSLVINGIGVVFVSASTTNSGGLFDITTIKITQTPVYFPPDLGTPELADDNFLFQQNLGQLLFSNTNPVPASTIGYYNQGYNPASYIGTSKLSYIISDKDTIMDSLVRVDLSVVGGNPFAEVFPYNPVDARKHYFTQSAVGITDVRSYSRLFIPEVFPNVDLHHYSNSRGLKSYFVFKTPGESLRSFRLQVEGAQSTAIDSQGNLVAATQLGPVNMGKVTAYQVIYNPIAATYSLSPLTASWNSLGSGMYNFSLSSFLPFWPVVVYVSKPGATSATAAGPAGNVYWSTLIGGQGADAINRTRTDARDNLYIGGNTSTSTYPVFAGGFFPTPLSLPNTANLQYGILTKFRSDGSIKFSSYYGGSLSQCGYPTTQIWDVAVDSLYNIYMVGLTTSYNLVTKTISVPGALNGTVNLAGSSGGCMNGFFARVDSTGSALHYASYYGGTGGERFNVASYANGGVYMAGSSASSTLALVSPQPNTYQITSGSGMYMHIDTSGAVKHSTKLQQSVLDGATDKNGNFYMVSNVGNIIGGGALIQRAPAPSFYTAPTASAAWDWGIQRFSPADSLTWSTNFGGTGSDFIGAMCIRDSVMAICGNCDGDGFPFVKSATDSGDVAHVYDIDVGIAKFNIKTGQRIWAAYHATGNIERAYGIALDKDFNLYVTGVVECPPTNLTFPSCLANGFKVLPAASYYLQNYKIDYDAFMLGYNSKNQRRWTTYFGSLSATTGQPNADAAYGGMACQNKGSRVFMGGHTNCPNNTLPFAKWNANCYYDTTYAGAGDGFVTMFDVTGFAIVSVPDNGRVVESSSLLLFPNPNSGIFKVKFTAKAYEKVGISVFNAVGQMVYEKSEASTGDAELSFDLSALPNGVYLIRINNGQQPGTVKMIKD